MDKALKKFLKNGKFENVSEKRSKAMAAVRSTGNKSTEQRLRFAMVSAGLSGWRVQPKSISGKPDFVFDEKKVAVFVDGCYWHGCPECGHIPKTRSEFWEAKIGRTKERDIEKTRALKKEGFGVLRFWEHELQLNLKKVITEIDLAVA